MQVVFLSPHSDPEADLGEPDAGGQCVYEYQLAQALSRMPNTQVHIFCRQTFRRPDISRVSKNFIINRITCGPARFVPKEQIEPWLPEFSGKVWDKLHRGSNTVIHSHYWDGGKAGLLLQQLYRQHLPMVWTPHSLGSQKRETFPGFNHEVLYNFVPRLCWENYTCFASERVIVSSQEEKDTLLQKYGVESERISIIPPGVASHQLRRVNQRAARKKYTLPLRGKVLLTLGRLTPSKGYHHALRAFAALKKIYTSPVTLVICAGSATSKSTEEKKYLQQLRQQARELGVYKQVIFRPAVSHRNIHQLYSAADMVLVFSDHEPFGLTVIEAMVMKRPVVAANAGGPSSLIAHNQTGVLVNVTQPDRAAYYLQSLIKDEGLVQKITDNAYEFSIANFDWSAKAKAFRQTYLDALHVPTNQFASWSKTNFFLQHTIVQPAYAVLH